MQALALKYRPHQFSELVGQDMVSKSLSNALTSQRLGHAYLFSGLRGSGKTSTARIFAKALLCEKGPNATPCDECENCKMANEGSHIDIIELDAASHRSIDDIRELIEKSRYAPSIARFKVFIIDEVHMLTNEAFNALLKTLEEPPSYVKFILATTNPLSLPATVLSRTQHFRFKPIAKNFIIKQLKFILENENIAYEEGALEILARSGSGSLRDTITLLDQAIIYSKENVSVSAVSSMLGLLDPNKIDEILQIVINQDRQKATEIIKELENYDSSTILDEIIINLKEKFLARDPNFSILMYERFFRIISEAKMMLLSSSDNGFTLGITLFLMMEAVNLREIDDVIESAKINLKPQESSEIKNLAVPKVGMEPAPTTSSPQITPKSDYERFLDGLYYRNYELGECFKKDIEYVKFEDNNLCLISRASGDNRLLLRSSSKAILQELRKIYGENAKIKIEQNEDSQSQNLLKENLSEKLQNLQNKNESDIAKEGLGIIHNLGANATFSQEDKNEKNLKTLEDYFGQSEPAQ